MRVAGADMVETGEAEVAGAGEGAASATESGRTGARGGTRTKRHRTPGTTPITRGTREAAGAAAEGEEEEGVAEAGKAVRERAAGRELRMLINRSRRQRRGWAG